MEKAIGYKLKARDGQDNADNTNLQRYLLEQHYVNIIMKDSDPDNDEFLYFCPENFINDYKNEKSAFLEEAFDLMQVYDGCIGTPMGAIRPDQIVKVDFSESLISSMDSTDIEMDTIQEGTPNDFPKYKSNDCSSAKINPHQRASTAPQINRPKFERQDQSLK